MSLKGLLLRAQVINQVRQYLRNHHFNELEPQLLAPADTLEPTIYPFKVGDYYLPTSPEAFLKQAMAAGIGNCFAISHVFRALEGEGRLHSPEFIMVEWYAQNTSYLDQIRFTQNLVSTIIPNLPQTWATISWKQLWQQHLQVNLDDLLEDNCMIQFAIKLGLSTHNATWEQLFHQIADIYLVKHFPRQPFFLLDYPAKISPLAKTCSDNPGYAQRFELFIHGIELANGNTESFDVATIQSVMESEQQARSNPSPLYHQFLTALSTLKHQTWSGVGLGLDRLAMLLGRFHHLRDLQTF